MKNLKIKKLFESVKQKYMLLLKNFVAKTA